MAPTPPVHEESPSLKRQKAALVVTPSLATLKRKATPNVHEEPVTSKIQIATPAVESSFATGKRKMTAKVFEEQVSPERQKATDAQTAPPVPHPFEFESSGAAPSESIFEARAQRVAEKAQREGIVRAARLEKCKKKEPVKHCKNSSWAAEIKCGVCLETIIDDDTRCLPDPSDTDNSSRARTTAEVHFILEAVKSVIDLETDREPEEENDDTVDEKV